MTSDRSKRAKEKQIKNPANKIEHIFRGISGTKLALGDPDLITKIVSYIRKRI